MSTQYTDVKFNQDANNSISAGIREVTESVATTLGPLGRNVLIDKGYETVIVHDGVTVANSIYPEDPYKRNGAKVIQEAAKKQRDEVGDGTTAVMILAQSIYDQIYKVVSAGENPMPLRRSIEKGAKKVIDRIQKLSKPVKSLDKKIQIATISAEDPELGKLIAETVHKVGDNGVITVEESKAAETYVDHQEGMQIDKGYAHAFMITDQERQIAVLEDAYVLITDLPLNDLTSIGAYLETLIKQGIKKILFISPEVGGDFLTAMVGAKIQGQFLGVAVRAPGIGANQTEILQDMCALTGATFISKEAGHTFDQMTYEVLGKAKRIVCSKISTIITGGAGHKDDILQRLAVIRKQMEDDTISDFDREQLKGRLGKLTDGVAVIRVAGQTEIEMKERKERAIDAVCAVQAAVRHGAVPGGEIAYLTTLIDLDEKILGEKILKEALQQPFRRLVTNAGYDAGQIYERIKATVPAGYGFDVTDGKIKKMIDAGILDPTAVPVSAIKNAVSVATQLSLLGAAVVLKNIDSKNA